MIKGAQVRLISWVLLLGIASGAWAQTEPELTEALVESRIAALREAGASDDEPTLSAYQEVSQSLNQVATHERDAQAHVDALTSAPDQEAEILARIEALDEDGEPVADLAGESVEQLQAQMATLRTKLREASSAAAAIDRQLAARETNARLIRERLEAITVEVAGLPDVLLTVNPRAPPTQAEAADWRVVAQRRALAAERRAQEKRLESQPSRYGLLRAQRAQLTGRIERLSLQLRAAQTALSGRRAEVVETVDLGVTESSPVFELAQDIAVGNAQLREARDVLARRLDVAVDTSDDVERRTGALGERFDTARRVADFASDSDVLGTVLLVHWREIDSFRISDPTRQVSQAVGDTVISRIGHEEELAERASSTAFVASRFASANIDDAAIADADREALRALVRTSRERLAALIAMESDFIEALSNLDSRYRRFTARVREYETFLGSRILWVPSHLPIFQASWAGVLAELGGVAEALFGVRFDRVHLGFVFGVLLAVGLFFSRNRLAAAQVEFNRRITRPRDDSILFSLGTTLVALLRAAPAPLLLHALALQAGAAGGAAANALATALNGLAVVTIALLLLKRACADDGVGRLHFGWKPALCGNAVAEVDWLVRWWLPVAGVAFFVLTFEAHGAAQGRLWLLVALVMLGLRLVRTPALNSGSRARRVRRGGLLVIVGLMVAVIQGYVYSVIVAAESLVDTLWLGVGLLLVYGILMRWLRVAQRHLRLAELMAARTSEEGDIPDADAMNLGELSEATSRLLRVGVVATGVLVLFYLWAPLLPAFDALDRVTLWSTSRVVDGESVASAMTLGSLVLVLFLAVGTFYAARKLPALVELILRSWEDVSPSGRYTTSTMLNYLIVGTGIIAILSTLGLQWSQLQWLVAALGVGIGFGLQEIVANFISGLIILFERPIRVGDIVTVGTNDGTVTRIRIRATTIRDWDGKELLVPNKEFITQRLLNWSLSDPITRLVVNVGVAYGSDVERAMQILREVAEDQPKVLQDPEPSVVFTLFGDNSLNLALRCHIAELADRMPVTTDLHSEINKRFNEAGVVISFPQRDVHFDSTQPIRVALEGGSAD